MISQGSITVNSASWAIYASEDQAELAQYIGVGGALPVNTGALLILPSPVWSIDVYSNMLGFSVDCVFIGGDGTVLEVIRNIIPGSGNYRYSGSPISYVLTVHANEAMSIHVGDTASITFPKSALEQLMPLVAIVLVLGMVGMMVPMIKKGAD